MMEDISNRTLAIILIAAILISFGGTLLGMSRLTMITGAKAPKFFVPLINAMSTATATVNLSIYELTELNWTPKGLNWSEGRVDTGSTGCTITSDGNTGAINIHGVANNCTVDPLEEIGGAVSDGLNLSNTGNTNVSINISISATPATFIGGSGVSAKWNVSDAWGQICSDQCICLEERPSTWTDFATTDTVVCNASSKFRPIVRNNTLRFDFEFVIPNNAPAGGKNATVTATYAKETG
jgi:hypothetical protein